MKKYLWIAIIILLVIAGYVLWEKGHSRTVMLPGTQQATSTQPTVLTIVPLVTEKKSENDPNKSYTLDMSYPRSSAKELPEIYSFVQSAKASFLEDFADISDHDAVVMDLKERPYNFTVTTKIATSTQTVSYIVEVYNFEGGAHGGTDVGTFTYDASGKLVTLDRVFAQPYLDTLSQMSRLYFYDALPDVPKDQIDSGTEATTTNFGTWYMTDTTINFIFGEYQIGPHAIGIQEFPLDKSKVTDLLSSEFK